MRPESGDAREGRVLDQIIWWTSEGIEYKADPRQEASSLSIGVWWASNIQRRNAWPENVGGTAPTGKTIRQDRAHSVPWACRPFSLPAGRLLASARKYGSKCWHQLS